MPKINRKLTDREIREAKPKDKNYFLFDDGNLRLLVRPTGKKVWQFPYKFDGKNNIYTIGQYGTESPKIGSAQARTIRDEIKELLSQGLDPNKNKKTKKQEALVKAENTFESIAEEWRQKQSWTEKHSKNIQSRLQKDVYPIIGWKAIKEVTIQDILQILRNIEQRDAVSVAQRINGYCTEIFDYALVMGICDSNPALGRAKFLKAHTIQNRAHISEKELPDFVHELYTSSDELNLTILAIKLLVLTLQRPGEIRFARWEEFDKKKAIWNIPAHRMKKKREHVVPLPKQALEVLDKIKVVSGNSEFLFPGRIGFTKPISDVALIKAMKKLSGNKMTPHGIRHTGSTILNENSFNSDWIERQLSHVEENKVRGTYNKAEYLEQRKDMMQWWADYLEKKTKKRKKNKMTKNYKEEEKITTYEDFKKNSKICTLRSLIHLFAYTKDNNWKFEQEIPESNFCFTFHKTWWRLDFGFGFYEVLKGNFSKVHSLIYKIDYKANKTALIKATDDRQKLSNIYDSSTSYSFDVTKKDFIAAHKLLTKIMPNHFKPKTSDELSRWYSKTKNFYKILNEFEEFLYNLSDEQLSSLGARATSENSAEFFPIKEITKKQNLYSYSKGLITELLVKKSYCGDDYLTRSYVEFDFQKSINFFENISNKEKKGKRGKPDRFDKKDEFIWKALIEDLLKKKFEEIQFKKGDKIEVKRTAYARQFVNRLKTIPKAKRDEFESDKIKRFLDAYKRTKKINFKEYDHFITLINNEI